MEAETAGTALSDLIPEDVYAYSTTGVNVGDAVASMWPVSSRLVITA